MTAKKLLQKMDAASAKQIHLIGPEKDWIIGAHAGHRLICIKQSLDTAPRALHYDYLCPVDSPRIRCGKTRLRQECNRALKFKPMNDRNSGNRNGSAAGTLQIAPLNIPNIVFFNEHILYA